MLGNFEPWLNNTTKPTTFPTLQYPIHDYDCKQLFDLGVQDDFINTSLKCKNVTNWLKLEHLLLINKANIQSVFVHLGATDELKDPFPRTKEILEFINRNKLPLLQKSPDPNNKDLIKDILDEITTSIVINQQ